MGRNQEGVEFTRRRFTLPPELDATLEGLADQNYQGNVSLCLRAAIEDHRATLSGTDSNQIVQQLITRVQELSAQQQEVLGRLESINDDLNDRPAQALSNSRVDSAGSELKRRILAVLQERREGLRVDDLVEEFDEPTSRVVPAIGSLLDDGHIVSNGASSRRYRAAGYYSKSASEQL